MSNDWTDKLREHLADYQEPVKDDLWAAIEQSLAHQDIAQQGPDDTPVAKPSGKSRKMVNVQQKTAKMVILRRFSIAAALAALAVGGAYIYLQKPDTSSSSLIADRESAFAGYSKKVQDRLGIPSVASANENQNNEINRTSAENVQTSVSAESVRAAASSYSNAASLVAVASHSSDTSSATDTFLGTDNPKPTDESPSASKSHQQPRSKKSLQSNEEQLAMATPSYETETVRLHHHKSSWSIKLYGENGVVGSNNSNGFDMASMPSSDAAPPVYPGTFGDGFYNTSLLAVKAMQGAPSADYYEKVKHHFPVSVGLQAAFGITDQIRVSTGVVYTYVSSDFINSSYNTKQSTTQTLHYVGVPLNVSYDFWQSKRFKTYVTVGGEGDINVKNHTESAGKTQEGKRDRMQWSANAALGAQYDIIPQLGIYVEPGAKYYFDNGSQIENTFKDKKFNFNLQFGLRWNIK